uniref:Uncharacterized protein n=1 Tax=Spongospora subterranea TaxID=70186 RepID=A0A0H5RFA0_9EUKA|eukprot:CRZ12232.1 hypothetical protein [Spongospora subterranea]
MITALDGSCGEPDSVNDRPSSSASLYDMAIRYYQATSSKSSRRAQRLRQLIGLNNSLSQAEEQLLTTKINILLEADLFMKKLNAVRTLVSGWRKDHPDDEFCLKYDTIICHNVPLHSQTDLVNSIRNGFMYDLQIFTKY